MTCTETLGRNIRISIHSLRMEGDLVISSGFGDDRDFNPLPPHGGRRGVLVDFCVLVAFQSTPSAWRETQKDVNNYVFRFISIHSLRMEGDITVSNFSIFPSISIHSLRMEGDMVKNVLSYNHRKHFNPLPPHGGRLDSEIF